MTTLSEAEVTYCIRNYLRDKKKWTIVAYHPPGGNTTRYILNPYRKLNERLRNAKSPNIVAEKNLGTPPRNVVLLIEDKPSFDKSSHDIRKARDANRRSAVALTTCKVL